MVPGEGESVAMVCDVTLAIYSVYGCVSLGGQCEGLEERGRFAAGWD